MTEQEKVQDWNRRVPIGAAVVARLESGEVLNSTTRCEARISNGRAVIWVRGISGAYPIDRVQPASETPAAPATTPIPTPSPTATPGPAWRPSPAMRFEVVADPSNPNAWRVEAIDRNGDEQLYLAVFRGPAAEARAREYAAWKNAAKG